MKNLVISLAVLTVVRAATIVDLSQEWEVASLYNRNTGSCAAEALRRRAIGGYVVVQHGVLVAEGYGFGRSATDLRQGYSTTKSWSTMLLGYLVDNGMISLNATLADVFPDEAHWVNVTDAEVIKTITVYEVATMTGGLKDGDINGQTSVNEVLRRCSYNGNLRGSFNYLASTHLVSRIVEAGAGKTPGQLAVLSGIFPALGITSDDYNWDTFGGVEGSAYGMNTSPRTMAKVGQLFLQDGVATPGEDPIISTEWTMASGSNLLPEGKTTFSPFNRGTLVFSNSGFLLRFAYVSNQLGISTLTCNRLWFPVVDRFP